jgi:hypothetical protein
VSTATKEASEEAAGPLPSVSTAAKEANATAAGALPSVSTAALAGDQASVKIIARGTIASIAAEQASASIVDDAAGARTVLLRPTPHHDVKSRCKGRGMQAVWWASMEQVVEMLGCWIGVGVWWELR